MYKRIINATPAAFAENSKLIHTCSYLLRKKNHYEVLEIHPNATAADVKKSYYKLSKMYHPDTNKDNPEAVEKFREVSESYEVIGNYKLRKLYDKGILHTAGGQYAQSAAREAAEEDPQTRFYRMRMKRAEAPQAPGEAPVYNFDEWTKNHYGASFDKKMKQKKHQERVRQRNLDHEISLQVDKTFYIVIFAIFVLLVLIPQSYDEPKPIEKTTNEQNDE